ncbi:hypothetical protein F8388_025234 [Cannabis sativa]|uniref:Uncharacterized protein n=1 Tax=Cannabis sativa TaxID=3483 RepID=A0A7J6FUX7_CANSA|nr:hypothetical protein F8388_025234 [Cannabis sativa]
MALLSSITTISTSPLLSKQRPRTLIQYPFSSTSHLTTPIASFRRTNRLTAFCFNPTDEPILKDALKYSALAVHVDRGSRKAETEDFCVYVYLILMYDLEPVAFMGGLFAGLLRLDLNDDPLKEWVSRTVEASGITEEEIDADGLKPEEEEVPTQIEIE